MKIADTLHINAPAEKVWTIVAHQFTEIGSWASAIVRSTPNLEATIPEGAEIGGRVCHAKGFGDIKETFLNYDEDGKTFTYFAEGGPFFMKSAHNTWTVIDLGDGSSNVIFAAEMNLYTPFNWLMGIPLRIQINRLVKETTEELKYYIETGEPHPRKAKQFSPV